MKILYLIPTLVSANFLEFEPKVYTSINSFVIEKDANMLLSDANSSLQTTSESIMWKNHSQSTTHDHSDPHNNSNSANHSMADWAHNKKNNQTSDETVKHYRDD